jgi:hypothetical protein
MQTREIKEVSMNLLVEDWGGKFQLHDISAKWNWSKRIIRKYYLKQKF